ncbi:MAG: twin-arginine translocase subunit TatC [Candidatus Cloacimonas sp.]|jgi:sec-independent protein translocase protein TatC|nr:twin-arginine translocase subunit TatC [Candidatus Cloacimonas sp.]
MKESNDKYLTFGDHFQELRVRLLLILAIFFVLFIISWAFRSDLLNLYLKLISATLNVNHGKIIQVRIGDKLQSHLMISGFVSLVLLIPIALVIISGFVSPALSKSNKQRLRFLLSTSTILFYIGIAFSYFFIIPLIYNYFLNYSSVDKGLINSAAIETNLNLSLKELVSSTQNLMISFALVTQIPLIMLLLYNFGIVSMPFLKQYRRHLYVVCFIIAAILTPPDPVSMVVMALPMLLLFELGMILCKVFTNDRANNSP